MRIFNQNGKIYVEFEALSKTIKRSLGLNYNEKNLKFIKKTILPIFLKLSEVKSTKKTSQKQPKNGCKNSLKTLCDEFINSQEFNKKTTQNTARYAIKRAFDFLDDKAISSYTSDDFKACLSSMQRSLKPSTIRLIFCYILLVFRRAKERNLIKNMPFKSHFLPKNSHKKRTIWTPKQIKLMLKNATNELKIFLYIAFYSGARSGEILALNANDIDYKNGVINISKNQTRFELTTPKNGVCREIFMPRNLAHFLKAQNFTNGQIFSSDYFAIYYQFKKLLKSLKLPTFGLHTTRHAYTSTLMNGLISPQFIANALGHSSLNHVNNTYSHLILQKSQLKKAQKVLDFG
ncbi:tyrosine-type recombinase/integrase [Campylobacter gastrosuis]|uniref:Site-specific integrase n=1 Tax=Campylobacter gastrosuis TaxID=2974576 RepID=A0ABT7HTZ5_9BACT|nr:tyrosine-type recombinase/integrase [Campylobacter gastrosuis]MDL0090093.1 site-specific integrase [Campylobacter gastrosuis]